MKKKKHTTKKKKHVTDLGDYLRQHGERGYTEKQAAKRQERLIKEFGYSAAPEAQPALRHYLPQLKKRIKDHFSDGRRDKDVRRALRRVKDLPKRLLRAGFAVAVSTRLGKNREGVKDALHTELWIGDHLEQKKADIAQRVGQWGVDMLRCLPIFTLDEHGALVVGIKKGSWEKILPTVELINLLDEGFNSYVASNPRLMPSRTPPPGRYTDIWREVLSSDPDWKVHVPLVKPRTSQKAIRHAIRTGMMGKFPLALDAIYAQEIVPCMINKPVLDVAMKMAPKVPPMPAVVAKYGEVPPWLAECSEAAADWQKDFNKVESWHFDMSIANTLAGPGWERFFVWLKLESLSWLTSHRAGASRVS
jgi:hypothetical protein